MFSASQERALKLASEVTEHIVPCMQCGVSKASGSTDNSASDQQLL